MKYVIGLDLSTKATGFAKFDTDGNLIEFKKIKPKTTLSTLEKMVYIWDEIYKLFTDIEVEKVVIEDIFLKQFKGPGYMQKNNVKGFTALARLSGGVISTIVFVTKQKVEDIIILRSAVSARPMVQMKGNCQKAEVQKWALDKFTDVNTDEYEELISSVYAEKQVKQINQKEFKKRMGEISKKIEKDTGFGEDISDALLLGFGETIK